MSASISRDLCVCRGQKWLHPFVEDVPMKPKETNRRRYHASVFLLHARQCAMDWVGVLGSHMRSVAAPFA